MAEISIIILTKNAGRKFKKILAQVSKQKIDKEFEVIIIDSGSRDKTLKIAHQFPVAKILEIKPEEFEHGKTRNLGAILAQGEYLVYLPQDAMPVDKNWLANLILPLKDEGVAGTFSRQIAYPQTNLFEKYYLGFLYPAIEPKKWFGNIFFSNVGSAIKKSVWQKIKFPEGLIMSEDQAWAKEVLSAGYEIVYQPEAIVYHSHNYSCWKNFKRNFDSGMSLAKLNLIKKSRLYLEAPRYLLGEIWFLIKKRIIFALLYLPFMIIYESFRALGFWLGTHYKILPMSWRKKFSLHKKNLE